MSKFRFRLEVIRELRQRAQDAQRRVLAERVRELDRLAGQMADLTRGVDDAVQQKRATMGLAELDVEFLRRLQEFRGWLGGRVADARDELGKQQALVGQERVRLEEASRRLKVVEKLRERQWNRHQMQCRRVEQAEWDEAALNGFGRRRRAQEPARDSS